MLYAAKIDDRHLSEQKLLEMAAFYTRLSQRVTQPLIASGLLTDKRDVCGALAAGAVAVSTTSEELWEA